MIEPQHPAPPITRQCEPLWLVWARCYHQPWLETDEDLPQMWVIGETYLAYPVFGSRQMTRLLRRQGHQVNCRRVRRLMQQMGLEASCRRPNPSGRRPRNPFFRYLLRRRVKRVRP